MVNKCRLSGKGIGLWQDTSTKDDVDDIVLSNTLHNFIEIAKAQKSQPEILYDQNAMIVWFERSKGKVRELLAFTMNPDIYGGAHKSHLKMKGQKDNSMEFSMTSLRHKKEPEAPDLQKGDLEKENGYWYTSYRNLREYAFFYGVFRTKYDPWTDPRTTPGQFGARASRLYSILTQGHNDVRLSKEDLHRITLWLDCNSDFFGSYEDTEIQAAGKILQPTLD